MPNPLYIPRSAETWRNPFDMYTRLRDEAPVYRVADNREGEDYYVFSRYRDVFAAGVDGETYTSTNGLTFSYKDMDLHEGRDTPIVMMDGPEHLELRQAALKRFKPQHLAAIEPVLRTFVIERFEKLKSNGGGDIVAELFKPLPSLFVSIALGVPAEDRHQFDNWAWAVASASATGNVMAAGEAIMQMVGYFSQLIAQRTETPGDDMISDLVHTELADGRKLSMEKIIGVGFTMVLGGNDTATGLMGGATEILTANPMQKQLLIDDRSLIKNAIEEFLRLTSPVQGLARTVTRDVTVHDVMIPKGRKVMLLYASANRDPREYGDNADQCDVERNVRRHVTFSSGAHMCIGAASARMQARIVLEELLERCPDFSVDFDTGEFAQGNFVRRYESLPFIVG